MSTVRWLLSVAERAGLSSGGGGNRAARVSAARDSVARSLADRLIREAIELGASDVHISPGRERGAVRLRVDGVLRDHRTLPADAIQRLISRIKVLGRLDITDRLRPQDGKARVTVDGKEYDLRISTLPAGRAEKCVVRVLRPDPAVTLDRLNIPPPELGRLRELLAHREGIVLVTGPTGSGKTTTLYGALQELAQGDINVVSVEDPVEYDLPAITQTQVETRQGVTFASALRAILRQDPDVILVGEIRDEETAETAARAALTGHLVLATVHANGAVTAVNRLVDLGLHRATVASALRGALAQRLLRRLCGSCREAPGEPSEEEAELAQRYGMAPGPRPNGCAECGGSGYRGRLPLQEVMVVDPALEEAIQGGKGTASLQRLAVREGMRPMRDVALEWVRQEETTLAEVDRVVGRVQTPSGEAEGGPPLVIIVEEDRRDRGRLEKLLEREGYRTRAMADASRVPEVLAAMGPGVMVLDADHRELELAPFLAELRERPEGAPVPVLCRVGGARPSLEREVEILGAGANDVVGRDTEDARLLARLGALVRHADR